MARPITVFSYLLDSCRHFARDAWLELIIALAILTSLAAVCVGIGVFLAAWFGCELLAAQLRIRTGERPPRTAAWLRAGALLGGAVALLSSVGWLAFHGLGADMPVLEGVPLLWDHDLRPFLSLTLALLLALHFILPLTFAPIVLVHTGGTLRGAVAMSARLVAWQGQGRSFLLTFVSHLIQFAPPLASAVLVAILAERSVFPIAVAAVSPLVLVSVPVGQGMFVSSYRTLLGEKDEIDAEYPAPDLSKRQWMLITAYILVPVVTLAFVALSLLKPSRPPQSSEPVHGEVVAVEVREASDAYIPDTTLVVRNRGGHITVDTLDGGGVGLLRTGKVAHVRILRVRDAYAIEMKMRAGGMRIAWIDRAGVRLDDNLSARLADHLSLGGEGAIALYAFVAPFALIRVLSGGVRVRHKRRRPPTSEGSRARARLLLLVLVPLAILSVAAGVSCLR